MKTQNPIPPKLADQLLAWLCRGDLLEEILGDLHQYYKELPEKPKWKRSLLYWFHVLHFLRPFAIKKSYRPNPIIMFRHNFKIARRNLVKNKSYSLLNILGLAIGMACSILILLWVQHELSYDRFHTNANYIYRLSCNGGDFRTAVSPAGLAGGLQRELPEVTSTVRLTHQYSALFEVDNRKFQEKRVFYADSNFLDMFTFPLVAGNTSTALDRSDGIVITEETARKYFGDEMALGKMIRMNNSLNFTITGVVDNIPSNSHLQFDIILPMSHLGKTDRNLINETWDNFNFYTYIQLSENILDADSKRAGLLEKISRIYKAHESELDISFNLQPLADIHLHSNLQIDVAGHGNVQYVNIFFGVSLLILVVACINFMNLATARSVPRAKEVGLRKVVGARRNQLIGQFLSESLIISFLSLGIAVLIVYMMLPAFNEISGKQLVITFLDEKLLLWLITIALITGFLSGSYPALFLSGFKPVNMMKAKMKFGGSNLFFRNSLVVTQFAVSMLLLVGTIVIYNQLNYIKTKSLGFDKENLLYIPMTGELYSKREALETALQQNTLTSNYTIISDLPARLITGTINVQWKGKDPDDQTVIPSIDVDENFIDVFQVQVATGRGFSKAFATDESNYIINEKAMQIMGMTPDNVIGSQLTFDNSEGSIIGVVKDFNFKPLQYAIEPLVLRFNRRFRIVVVRTPANSTENAIAALEKIHHRLNPDYPFAYNFVDKDLENQYRGEQQMGTIFNLFALLAIFISCLGLYGLAAYTAEQRTREIGIRKVLGASTFSLVNFLSRDFLKLVALSLIIATPLSWHFMNQWLQDFAYRTEISWWMFAVAGMATLVLTILTVSYQVVSAALMNPVKSLRSG